jgi:hypothetical protein
VKLYTELNRRDDWRRLTFAERGVLVSIWVEYGASNGQIRCLDAPLLVGLRSHYAHFYRHLKALVDAGFLDIVASKPLALARSREKETEKKELKAPPLKRETPKPAPHKSNVQAADGYEAIARMIRNGVIQDETYLDAEIRGYHLDEKLAAELHQMLQ